MAEVLTETTTAPVTVEIEVAITTGAVATGEAGAMAGMVVAETLSSEFYSSLPLE